MEFETNSIQNGAKIMVWSVLLFFWQRCLLQVDESSDFGRRHWFEMRALGREMLHLFVG